MKSYYEKSEAARLKIESGDMDLREDPLGNMVKEQPYHVMYSEGFPGYFTYMVLCDFGELDDKRQRTSWGFDFYNTEQYSPYYRRPPATYEYCLSSSEVEAWLDKFYGNLPDSEEYKYLISILVNAHNSSGEFFTHTEYNKASALKWLNDKVEQKNGSQKVFAGLGLQWNTPRAEYIELMYGLFECGALTATGKGGRAGAIERLGEALGIEGKVQLVLYYSKLNSVIQIGKHPFLTELKKLY
ncbi:hypothetical protein KBK19_04890 [Microvirga sp. STR05]|uniref:Uncharacterized protein n=1 Tax=Hymenobacter duratus TaxID=2771356 RepID=A0ABR8JC69_9BACT|nr:hypothetical protein [Hymenobacter duratus]MBD2714366.1 hypothetical protein [Hymenobacter duratus]MBR7949269.1 hypothetical protein [Microvirga sp. STR05]